MRLKGKKTVLPKSVLDMCAFADPFASFDPSIACGTMATGSSLELSNNGLDSVHVPKPLFALAFRELNKFENSLGSPINLCNPLWLLFWFQSSGLSAVLICRKVSPDRSLNPPRLSTPSKSIFIPVYFIF